MRLDRVQPSVKPASTSAAKDWVRALELTAPIAANPNRTLFRVIESLAEKHADAPALLSKLESFSYGGLVERANRYARWALTTGLRKGDVVALIMPSRPEYIATWLGLSSVGVVVALLNTQLRGHSLVHCVDVVKPQHVIVSSEFSEEFSSVAANLESSPKVWLHETGPGAIDRLVEQFSAKPLLPDERPVVSIRDCALLIYTSGTTGLPKAANVSHHRLLQWSFWFAGLMNTSPDDRMYDCLPLYHGVGGIVATGAMLVRGGSVLIRKKFTARQFWDDVCDWNCTLVQYIGELCRYLVDAPKNPRERTHQVRMCCGNGLRADVWEKFQERFAIPRVLEFYASTEGNVSLYNVEGKIGAIGRVPPFLAHRIPLALVKFDPLSGQPWRNESGFCIRCAKNEVGEAIGRIRDDPSHPGGDFEGYTSATDTDQKILRNVFEHGDAWYRTGDLMRVAEGGFYYFVDRIGDTYRWKGENVATSEVADALTAFPGVIEANVYGVPIPGTEGAAGMAAIVIKGNLDLEELRSHLVRRLPDYAQPLFLRVTGKIEATATLKYFKTNLMREGYNPAATSEPIFFDDPDKQAFIRLDQVLYDKIQTGRVRV